MSLWRDRLALICVPYADANNADASEAVGVSGGVAAVPVAPSLAETINDMMRAEVGRQAARIAELEAEVAFLRSVEVPRNPWVNAVSYSR